jgi:hypothetical protein
MVQNTQLQGLKGSNPNTGLPSGILVTRSRELISWAVNLETTERQTWRRTIARKQLSENGKSKI